MLLEVEQLPDHFPFFSINARREDRWNLFGHILLEIFRQLRDT